MYVDEGSSLECLCIMHHFFVAVSLVILADVNVSLWVFIALFFLVISKEFPNVPVQFVSLFLLFESRKLRLKDAVFTCTAFT